MFNAGYKYRSKRSQFQPFLCMKSRAVAATSLLTRLKMIENAGSSLSLLIPVATFLFPPSASSQPCSLLLPSSLSSHSSFLIFTVSLSDSVVETCHSGLPKGRTPVLPCALCQKKRIIPLNDFSSEAMFMQGCCHLTNAA